jgi:hypothetical protein
VKERRQINAGIDSAVVGDPSHGLPHVEDPFEAIIAALLIFLKWFMLVRRMELADSEIAELATRGFAEELPGWKSSRKCFQKNPAKQRLGILGSSMI